MSQRTMSASVYSVVENRSVQEQLATPRGERSSEVRIKSPFEQWMAGRICVESPYNQLLQVAPFQEDGVTAQVVFESPSGFEVDQLASAEIGRHLAILGSCALARNNPSDRKHFYLATEALLIRYSEGTLDRETPLTLTARPEGKEHAEVELLSREGAPVAWLRCRYRVLSERAFARIFEAHRMEPQPRAVASPYATPVELKPLTDADQGATALLERVEPAMCVGHFSEYPAMPVAILMDGIHRLACRHIEASLMQPMRLVTCVVGADRLAFAGEAVEFGVTRMRQEDNLVHYEGFARRVGEPDVVFGRASLTYHLLDEDDLPATSLAESVVMHVGALRARDPKLPR